MSGPRVSILIVNWNGAGWLPDCVRSLRCQSYLDFETIFIDNGSNDESLAYIRKHMASAKIIALPENYGFAIGNIHGLSKARGEYILLLNNDVKFDKNFLQEFVDAFDDMPQRVASLQSKIVLLKQPSLIDSVGAYWTSSSFLYYVGNNKPESNPKYNHPRPVFSNKGASMMLRKSALDAVGFLDGDFWCYYEETDLCNRLWLAGYECWYTEKAKILHDGGNTSLRFSNDFVQFHNFKNKLMSFTKNYQVWTLIKTVPVFLSINIVLSIVWLVGGKPKHAAALYRAIWWNITHFTEIYRKRRQVQSLRKVTDKAIFRQVKRNPKLSFYRALFTGHLAHYQDAE